jgi:hypothetical protein
MNAVIRFLVSLFADYEAVACIAGVVPLEEARAG